MKILSYSLFLVALISSSAMATPAKESTIEELLVTTKAERLLGSMRNQINTMMDRSIRTALKGNQPNARQRQAITHMKYQMVALLKKGLTWEKLQPVYIRLYKETFTEEELNGMLAFYKTPAGQAVINKMPLLIRTTMLEIQHMTAELTPEMRVIQQQFADEMRAASK